VKTPAFTTIPSAVRVEGLDMHGAVLQLCPKLKKDHECVTKTLHEELFPGGAKVDVTFYCKGLSSGGCKTKKPARVCIGVMLTFAEIMTQINTSPFTVKGNRRTKIKRMPDTLREALSVTTFIHNPLITPKPLAPSSPSSAYLLSSTNSPGVSVISQFPPQMEQVDIIIPPFSTPLSEIDIFNEQRPFLIPPDDESNADELYREEENNENQYINLEQPKRRRLERSNLSPTVYHHSNH